MSTFVSQAVRALAWALVAAIAVQLYLAGAFVFGVLGAEPHRALGGLIFLASLLTALVSLASRATRRTSRGFFGLFGLMLLQLPLVMVRPRFPAVSALHAVNAMVVLVVAYRMARRAHDVAGARAGAETFVLSPSS